MMMCFCHDTIAPEAHVIEPICLDEDLKVFGLRIVCFWAQWSSRSSIYVFRDLDDDPLELEPDTGLVSSIQVTTPGDSMAADMSMCFRHSSNPECSLHFHPQRDVLWLSLSMTDEPHLIQGLRQAYGFAIDLIENIMMADWCWREQSVPEMARILDTFGGLRSVILVGDQEGEMLDEDAKERALDDLRDIAPRQ